MASHSFSGNYMILRPEEVSIRDLLGILCNCDFAQKAFVEFPIGREENLPRRWLLFISLLAQKVLQRMERPMSWFGSACEMALNILSCNHNFFVLLLRVLQKKVIVPGRTSDMFLSFVGNSDKRVQLDNSIKNGDSRYYAMLCAMASKLSYENKVVVENTVRDCWKMELIGYYDFWNDFQRKYTTQGFMFHDKTADPDVIIIAFRGTELFDADAWCTDIDISWYELPGMGKIHGGFMKALGLLIGQGWPPETEQDSDRPLAYYTIRENLRQLLKANSKTNFILTGHSLGGALAILFAAVLALHEETFLLKRLEGVYTFGQPRVGDEEFKMFMEKQLYAYGIKYLRFVYSHDVIPRLPSDDFTFLFKHFGTCLYFNSFYQGKIVEEEPDKNYMSPWVIIPRMINAFWELLRSFIIPYIKGPDYSETWLLKLIRFVGLALPGLAAHNPHDYINTTRLGSHDIYLRVQER
ncbi:Lipase, partial [Melia azedarach]